MEGRAHERGQQPVFEARFPLDSQRILPDSQSARMRRLYRDKRKEPDEETERFPIWVFHGHGGQVQGRTVRRIKEESRWEMS